MKYAITVEDLVPRHRELTVVIPDDLGDTDDLSEYLDRHPELWRDTRLPADHQTITSIGPAAQPEPLTHDQLIALEWDETTATHHMALVTVGELIQELEAATGRRPEPFRDPVEMSWYLRGGARDKHGLDTWLNLLHAQNRANPTSTTQVDDPLITGARLATDAEHDEHHATTSAAVPAAGDNTVRFRYTETSRGHGHVGLTELAETRVWQPGTPVTAQVLEEYFGASGEDRGPIVETVHDYGRISYTGPDGRSCQ